MLVYHSRKDIEAGRIKLRTNFDDCADPFETFCNWSYPKEMQLSRETLIELLNSYNKKYDFMYRRIFNEVPQEFLIRFVEETNASLNGIKKAYRRFVTKKKNVRLFSL